MATLERIPDLHWSLGWCESQTVQVGNKQKSELWPLHRCSVSYLTGWYHWRVFTLLDYVFIKATDQIRKPALWVEALNQAGNTALQLLLTQQEIRRSLLLCANVSGENNCKFFLVLHPETSAGFGSYSSSASHRRAVQSESCTALSGCSSEIPGWPVCIIIYLQCFGYAQ